MGILPFNFFFFLFLQAGPCLPEQGGTCPAQPQLLSLPPSQVLLAQGHVQEAKNQPNLCHQLPHSGRRAGDFRRVSFTKLFLKKRPEVQGALSLNLSPSLHQIFFRTQPHHTNLNPTHIPAATSHPVSRDNPCRKKGKLKTHKFYQQGLFWGSPL